MLFFQSVVPIFALISIQFKNQIIYIMKANLYFFKLLVMSFFPSLLFSQERIPQPETLKFGAFTQVTKANVISGYNAYGFDFRESSKLYMLMEPMSQPGTWGLVDNNQTLRIKAGAWTGTEWIVYATIKPAAFSDPEIPGFYLSVEPVSGKFKKIGTGNAHEKIIPNCMTYNPKDKEIFGIMGTALYKMSLTDTTITLIDTLRLDEGVVLIDGINVIASDAKGVIYAISVKNNVYKVDKNTAKAVFIGNTGTSVGSNLVQPQSACFDYRTNRMYWAAYNPSAMYEVDTLTGKAVEIIPSLQYLRSTALFVHYYTQDCPPGDVFDMISELDPNDPTKLKITAKAPLLNFNGDVQTDLAKAYLYRKTTDFSATYIVIDSINISQMGGDIVFNVEEKAEGTYMYGIKVRDNAFRYNLLMQELRENCFKMTLPYSTGFEAADDNFPITVEYEPGWILVDSNSNEGNRCYYVDNASGSRLQINGIPVKKGASYNVSLKVRTGTGQSKLTLSTKYILNSGSEKSLPVKTVPGPTYSSFDFPIEILSENGFLNFYIKGIYGKSFFVDDIKITQISTEKVPDTTLILSYDPVPKGENAAIVKWQTPSTDASGGPIENLTGIIVKKCQNSSFSESSSSYPTYTDTVFTFIKGAIDSAKINVPKAGRWYFRLYAYNSYGISPYYSNSKLSAWIGIDTVPVYPTEQLAEALLNGRIRVTWDSASDKGTSGGYLNGTITAYKISYYRYDEKNAKVYDTMVSGTEFITPSLPEGAYKFSIQSVRNNLNMSAIVNAGSFAVSNNVKVVLNTNRYISMSQGTSTMPFMFSEKEKVHSSICQSVYTKQEMGGPRVIDTLIYYVQVPQYEKVPVKIYMDYKKDTAYMSSNEDWVSFRQKTTVLVFDDSIEFSPGIAKLSIPIKPFFYNGSEALLTTLIKKKTYLNGNLGNVLVYSVDFHDYTLYEGRVLFQTRKIPDATYDFIDYDTLGDVSDLKPFKAIMQRVPCLLITEPTILGEIRGSIKSRRTGEPIMAKISISPLAAGNGLVDIKYDFYNDTAADGEFNFTKMVPNGYTIRFSALGYTDSVLTLTMENNDSKILNILLDDAQKVTVRAVVKDEAGLLLASVPIELDGIENYKTISSESGEFSFEDLYNHTTYHLKIVKSPYQDYTQEIQVGAVDTNLGEIIMNYPVSPVSYLIANKGIDSVSLEWKKPSIETLNPQWIQWCNDSSFNAFGADGIYIMGAARFSPQEMKKQGITGKKLKTIRFRLTEYQANYTVRVFQGTGTTKEIFSKNMGPKNLPAWYDIELPGFLDIDTTQDLYIAVDAAEGYLGYPIPVDEGPRRDTLTSVVYLNGKWQDINTLNPNFNFNISIKAVFAYAREVNPTKGYNIYRLRDEDREYPERWLLINNEEVKTTKYIDNTWNKAPMGWYRYAVRANYGADRLSAAVTSAKMTKDLEFNVDVKVDGGVGETDAYVCLFPKDGNLDHKYEGRVRFGKSIRFENVWRGEYEIGVRNATYAGEFKDCTITGDTLINFNLSKENISDPVIIKCTLISGTSAKLEWNMLGENSFYDSFEDRDDFAISELSPFILSNPVRKGGVENVTWKNSTVDQSWIVMNTKKTVPAINTALLWAPMKGSTKYLAAFYAKSGANDDWLILPINTSGNLSFYANGIGLIGVFESMQLMISQTTADKAAFKPLTFPFIIDKGWKSYSYYLPKDVKFVAVRYVSNDVMALLLDEFRFRPEGEGVPQTYELYIDGTKVTDVSSTINEYTFRDLASGTHKLGVKAIFRSGASKLVESEINIVSNEISKEENGLKIYPNPSADGRYYIDLDKSRKLEVYSLEGVKILSRELLEGIAIVDLGKQPAGMYFFVFDKNTTIKVLKSKK